SCVCPRRASSGTSPWSDHYEPPARRLIRALRRGEPLRAHLLTEAIEAALACGPDAADRHVQGGADLLVARGGVAHEDPQQLLAALGDAFERAPERRVTLVAQEGLVDRGAVARLGQVLLVADRDAAAR